LGIGPVCKYRLDRRGDSVDWALGARVGVSLRARGKVGRLGEELISPGSSKVGLARHTKIVGLDVLELLLLEDEAGRNGSWKLNDSAAMVS
jgi:hypothetical protein